MARKSTGEIGPALKTEGGAALIPTALPSVKEEIEEFFASRFVEAFNQTTPLGKGVVISKRQQNTTLDLDFSIDCLAADYLELAELNPRSEEFGRAAYRAGSFNVYAYARWIWFKIIEKKARSYGPTASRTILQLYCTYWQFFPSMSVFDCLRSYAQERGCSFAAVYFLVTDGDTLLHLEQLHPSSSASQVKPGAYRTTTFKNIETTQAARFSVNIEELARLKPE